ncbi:CoA pyrophosphatase [Enterovirga sp.]|uniref:CoA pyrophosphatase n=1 Tax=Enterovirga sp. TaxID=2026350 RepID=UPI002C9E76F4|nr:CoA pyrophosphatase [Enterovirga sp.]HMO29620.1 CoA pyrophosphatase [Enterovirga sp.]
MSVPGLGGDTDFAALAAARLRPAPPRFGEKRADLRGDHAIGASGFPLPDGGPPRIAAVLIPVVAHPQGPAVILTERASTLRQHSGQIAFPGGKMDPEDPTPLATALRETQEEIGLEPGRIRPLGYLDAYLSGTNYFIIPTLGLVEPGFRLTLNREEVESVFEVPLSFLMDERNHELHAREWRGAIRTYYAMPFGERYIWGATAGILRNMHERLFGR